MVYRYRTEKLSGGGHSLRYVSAPNRIVGRVVAFMRATRSRERVVAFGPAAASELDTLSGPMVEEAKLSTPEAARIWVTEGDASVTLDRKVRYRGYEIQRTLVGWEFFHEDFDLDPRRLGIECGDVRSGQATDLDEAIASIDELEA